MKHNPTPLQATRQAARQAQREANRPLRKKRRRSQASPPPPAVPEDLKHLHPYAAGIDIGATQNFVCVPAHTVEKDAPTVRAFGVFNADLDATVAWLNACRITTVAMEATGIYWFALQEKLEAAGMEVVVVEPGSVKQVPGRKSDVLDCQWLQQLHTYGLLHGSFRPAPPIRRLRVLTRQRAELVQSAASCQQRMEKALVPMNLQLHLVVSDIVGATGLRILEAILAGEREAGALARLRDGRCSKSTPRQMKAALTGHYNEEGLFVLKQSLEAWKFHQQQLAACDQEIKRVLASLPTATPAQQPAPPKPVPSAPGPAPKKKPAGGNNALSLDLVHLGHELARVCGVDLTAVCGLNLLSVLMLIAEIGVDMSRWRSAKAFCSWLGLCPGTRISGGRVLSRRTRRVANRASVILRVAVLAIGRTDTWLGRFYRRKRAALGAPKANTATARKLACVIYHMLKYGQAYEALDVEAYEQQARAHRLRSLRREAQKLGMELIEKPQEA